MAAAANVELSEATIAIYLERLARLSDDEIEVATQRTIDEWAEASKMPPLAFILERAGKSTKSITELAFEEAVALINRDWYADDIGWVGGSQKKLTPAMKHAIRICGGEYKLAYATDQEQPFLRKRFLAAHESYLREGKFELAASGGDPVLGDGKALDEGK